jgi:tetratricopeptide (TPR) repeat protein
MPKRDVARISHSALSNHRIVRLAGESLPAQAYSQTTPDLPDLIFLNAAAGERSALPRQVLMLAYGELTEKEPSYVSKYLELLRESVKSDPANPVVLAAEGRRLLLMNTDESMRNAMDVLTRAVANGSTASTTFEDLAEVYARVGKLDDSIRTLQRGIEIAPFAPVLQKSLALRYIVQKRYAEAERTLERYVELFPEDDFVRGLLAKVRPVPSTR